MFVLAAPSGPGSCAICVTWRVVLHITWRCLTEDGAARSQISRQKCNCKKHAIYNFSHRKLSGTANNVKGWHHFFFYLFCVCVCVSIIILFLGPLKCSQRQQGNMPCVLPSQLSWKKLLWKRRRKFSILFSFEHPLSFFLRFYWFLLENWRLFKKQTNSRSKKKKKKCNSFVATSVPAISFILLQ